MSATERTPINATSEDAYDQIEDRYGYESREKNWPACKPILRHNIKADIPAGLQKVTKLVLFHCFYEVIFLLINFVAALVGLFTNKDSYLDDMLFGDLVISPVWLVGWGVLSFIFYHSLYKALAHRRRGHYTFFFCGSIFEILLSILAVIGIKGSALMGFCQGLALHESVVTCFLCFVVVVGFALNGVFLVVVLVKLQGKYDAVMNGEGAVEESVDAVAAKVGNSAALPREVGGRKITYLPPNAGSAGKSKVEKLSALPANSFTVISEWRKADSEEEGDAYILYVENEADRAYWSTPHVAGILNNGLVNPATQVLTISRLPGGSFVFGVADKV